MNIARLLLLISLLLSAHSGLASLNPALFPVHESYQPNVQFWIKVFANYSTQEVLIHDRYDLSKIYQVVRLVDADTAHHQKINRKRIKLAKKKIIKTLDHLAKGHRPANRQERHIASLFGRIGKQATAAHYRYAAKNLRVQSGAKERFAQSIIRSGRYLQEMQAIFKQYGLPPQLTYLPHVESSFNTGALSKVGATGLWQFTLGTGKRYLRIGESVDERRDPILATHAAAKLLHKNHSELSNWPLAITAYNHGLAGMKRAQAKHGDYPAVFSQYNGRSFKFASRNFYPEFLAAYHVATHARQYFGSLTMEQPQQHLSYRLPGYLPLHTLRKQLGLNSHVVHRHNPAFQEAVLKGQKYIPRNYLLRLPAHWSQTRIKQLLPQWVYKERQKPSLFHTVKKGETASAIARRHGVRLKDLMLVNQLNARATIYPRQKLRIPGRTAKTAESTKSYSNNQSNTIAQAEGTLVLDAVPGL